MGRIKEHLRGVPGLAGAYRRARLLRSFWTVGREISRVNGGRAQPESPWAVASLSRYVRASSQIPGWTRGDEAVALLLASYALPEGATVVEIGAFLGCSTVLLAGARKLRSSGKVYVVDSFDASGDAYSEPIYEEIRQSCGAPLREAFQRNLEAAGVAEWVDVYEGTEAEAARAWNGPVDLLFLDASQSYEAVQLTCRNWARFLRPGGILAVHNSRQGIEYAEDHDGSARLVSETVRPPAYEAVRCIDSITFAVKAGKQGG